VTPDSKRLPSHYTPCPLGLTDKADGSKRHIHHLSYPPSSKNTINTGIPEAYGVIQYSGIEQATQAVQDFGRGSLLMKRDFESAFRHIPISPEDTPLLGFHWQNQYYAERFLPLALRTAPSIFNLFTVVFHWILEQELALQQIPASVTHYLDDFLIVVPPGTDNKKCTKAFTTLCSTVGLSIKASKNEEGTRVSFAALEIEMESMVVCLPEKKLLKAHRIVESAMKEQLLSLFEIQRITSYLNSVAATAPLGQTFLRRL